MLAIGSGRPSQAGIAANAHALARYAGLCQAAGLVPIVEPEVLLTGPHSLAQCAAVTEAVLHEVFAQLRTQGVALEGILLKPSMVLAGVNCPHLPTTAQIADATLACLLRTVPAAVPGVAFCRAGRRRVTWRPCTRGERLPWALTFFFGRAHLLPTEAHQKQGDKIKDGKVAALVVGDLVLAQANVGIAVGSGTDIAAETADIILVNNQPTDITNLVEFGKVTYTKMRQNLWWAAGYNVVALPLAAGVLYPHFVLSPAMGAVLMSASTVIVALNAQLLCRSLK